MVGLGGSRRLPALGLGLVMAAATLVATVPPRVTDSAGSVAAPVPSTLSFEPNVGQVGGDADFVAHSGGAQLELSATEARLSAGADSVALRFEGADRDATGAGAEVLPGTLNFLRGDDPQAWQTGMATFGRVVYTNVYAGVDVAWYGRGGELEYDLVVAPGADVSAVRVGFSGVDGVRIDSTGDAVAGPLRQRRPIAYQETESGRRKVDARFVLRGLTEVGVEIGDSERDRPLVVDPVLVYSTFLGGTRQDVGTGIAVDRAGSAYVAGSTTSEDYPLVNPLQSTRKNGYDAVVSKLSPDGTTLAYSTYIGGNDAELANGIAVDAAGNAYVTGETWSADFPVQNAFQPTRRGPKDAFVLKLNPSGSAFVFSTFLGGDAEEVGGRIAVDANGNPYVAGETGSDNFPTRNPVQPGSGGGDDAFIVKFDTAGTSLVYGSYLGGAGFDEAYGLGVDAGGNAVVGGYTNSDNFPTLNAVQPQRSGGADTFVTRMNAMGSALTYSTYLGGTAFDVLYDLAVDPSGNAYATGHTTSANFPTLNPVQASLVAPGDAFITKLSVGGALVYSTFLGAYGSDVGTGIAVDPLGRASVTGDTTAYDFPTVNPIQGYLGGEHDAFVTTLNVSGSAIVQSTLLGGGGIDFGHGLAADGSGLYVMGQTTSWDFPTKNPFQAQGLGSGGIYDLFVTKISLDDAPPAVQGRTWYLDGTSFKSGPAGTRVEVRATGAAPGVGYRLVLARGDGTRRCTDIVAVLNNTTRIASAQGVIGTTYGTIPAGTPAESLQICFKAVGTGSPVTSPVLFTVT